MVRLGLAMIGLLDGFLIAVDGGIDAQYYEGISRVW